MLDLEFVPTRFDMEHLSCHFQIEHLELHKGQPTADFSLRGSSWKFYLIYIYDMMLDVVNIDLLTLLTFVQRSCCERESTPRLVCAKTNCCNHAISVTSLQPCTNMQRVVVLSIFREARRQKIAQFPSFRPWNC